MGGPGGVLKAVRNRIYTAREQIQQKKFARLNAGIPYCTKHGPSDSSRGAFVAPDMNLAGTDLGEVVGHL